MNKSLATFRFICSDFLYWYSQQSWCFFNDKKYTGKAISKIISPLFSHIHARSSFAWFVKRMCILPNCLATFGSAMLQNLCSRWGKIAEKWQFRVSTFQCPACDFTSTYSKNNVKSHMVSLHGLAYLCSCINFSNLLILGAIPFLTWTNTRVKSKNSWRCASQTVSHVK